MPKARVMSDRLWIGILDALKQLTQEQWESMSKEQMLTIRTGIALVGIQTKSSFINVALEDGELTVEDAHQLQAMDEIMREMLERIYPNGGWKTR